MEHQELTALFIHTKWACSLMGIPRAQMASDYLGKLEGVLLLVGMDYDGIVINKLYGRNLHNAYIRLHLIFGLQGVLLVSF